MNRAPSMDNPMTLKRVSRKRSLVGRSFNPRRFFKTRLRYFPAMTRMVSRPARDDNVSASAPGERLGSAAKAGPDLYLRPAGTPRGAPVPAAHGRAADSRRRSQGRRAGAFRRIRLGRE